MICDFCDKLIYTNETYHTFYYCNHCDRTYDYDDYRKEKEVIGKKSNTSE